MSRRRPIIAAVFTLAMLSGGMIASSAGATRSITMRTVVTTATVPDTSCKPGSRACGGRTKNAALPIPTTTAAKKATATTVKKKTVKPTTTTKPKKTTNKTTKTTVKK